jgi:transposase
MHSRKGGGMIIVPADVRVLIATKPVDFRRGADGLVETLHEDPFSGAIFVFRSKREWRVSSWTPCRMILSY